MVNKGIAENGQATTDHNQVRKKATRKGNSQKKMTDQRARPEQFPIYGDQPGFPTCAILRQQISQIPCQLDISCKKRESVWCVYACKNLWLYSSVFPGTFQVGKNVASPSVGKRRKKNRPPK